VKHALSWRASLALFRARSDPAIGLAPDLSAPPASLRTNAGRDETNEADLVAFPRLILSAGLGYTLERQNVSVYLNNRVHVGADEGPVTASLPHPDPLKDYWRTDLSITWRDPRRRVEIYLDVLNLLGRDNAFFSIFSAENGIPDVPFTASLGLRWTY